MKNAVIIKGNPKYTNNNLANVFYSKIKIILEQYGYQTTLDNGEPFTIPKPADLWIGHSRGADRLKFAHNNTNIIPIGSNLTNAICHPKDDVITKFHLTNKLPPPEHFILTNSMIQQLTSRI